MFLTKKEDFEFKQNFDGRESVTENSTYIEVWMTTLASNKLFEISSVTMQIRGRTRGL